MQIKSTIIVGLLGLTSCANQAEPFYISNFFPLTSNCGTGNAQDVVGNGYLDVAAGGAQFFVGAQVLGGKKLQQSELKVGMTTLEAENRNRPIISQVVVTYRLSKRVGATPKPYTTNITLPFDDTGTVTTSVQLISPDLATALFDGLAPSPGVAPSSVIEDFVDISADVEFKGELSGSRTPFTTGTLTYPVRAYRSNPSACTNGFVKYWTDATTNEVDFCRYVGQVTNQNQPPDAPSTCCVAAGSAGGAGC